MNSVRYFLGGRLCGKVARRLRIWAAQLDGGDAITGPIMNPVKHVCGVPCKLVPLRSSQRIHLDDATGVVGKQMVQACKDEVATELSRHVKDCVHFTEYEAGNEYRIEAELFIYKPVTP